MSETQIDIKIFDELSDSDIESTGKLDLETGEIHDQKYLKKQKGVVSERDDYEYSYGRIELAEKEIEFTITVEDDRYFVEYEQLLELKEKMNPKPAKKPRKTIRK